MSWKRPVVVMAGSKLADNLSNPLPPTSRPSITRDLLCLFVYFCPDSPVSPHPKTDRAAPLAWRLPLRKGRIDAIERLWSRRAATRRRPTHNQCRAILSGRDPLAREKTLIKKKARVRTSPHRSCILDAHSPIDEQTALAHSPMSASTGMDTGSMTTEHASTAEEVIQWFPIDLLRRTEAEARGPGFALIVLNQPITSYLGIIRVLWKNGMSLPFLSPEHCV